MAERVEDFDFGTDSRGRRWSEWLGNYRWHEWLDGNVSKMTQGIDFHCEPQSFVSQAHIPLERRAGTLAPTSAATSCTFSSAMRHRNTAISFVA